MGNNSKQAVLSIVGIAILVIAVVGVSFAFFTYSRQGSTNNVITTGTIEFAYAEDSESALVLENRFPQTVAEGTAETDKFEFDVHGTLPTTANAVNYNVYVVPGNVEYVDPTAQEPVAKPRFRDTEISIQLVTVTGTTTATVEGNYATGAPLTTAVGQYVANDPSHKGLLVATGVIEATGTQVKDEFELKMWVNDSVTISDTDYSKTYRAKAFDGTNWPEKPANDVENASPRDTTKMPYGQANDDRSVYSDLYYSIKVNVDAND